LLLTATVAEEGLGVYVVPEALTLAAVTSQLPGVRPVTVLLAVGEPISVRVAPGPVRVKTGVALRGRPLVVIETLPVRRVYDTVAGAATSDAATCTV
jgi:hypothetical protein